MQTRCWYCDFFGLSSGTAGHCRRHAPSSIDFQSIPGNATIAGDRVFPFIEDARIDWCGEFKPARGTVPDPPA